MQHIYKRRAVCSVLHGQLVCVRRVVHVVGHIGLNVGENVLVVVHIVPEPFCHINMFVNFWFKMYCIYRNTMIDKAVLVRLLDET